jgi:predicted TIM-barrel fold metal-dependent hydrolase
VTLFDANCMLGRRSVHTPLGAPRCADELLAEMDRLGIAEALVYHCLSIDGHPAEGNERLMREITERPRLHPCWVLLPTSGEMPAPRELVLRMRELGVRAARMFPTVHRYSFNQATVGDLLAELERTGIPLFVDFGVTHWAEQKTDWGSLDDLCGRYSELPIIVVGESLCVPRRLFPFWERHPNLLLETSYYQVHQGLSEIVERFGAHRLLFGTGLPVRAPGPPLAQLRYDFLSETARAAVGGGNLRRLLSIAGVQGIHRDGQDKQDGSEGRGDTGTRGHGDAFTAATDLPTHPILDAHVHLGTWFSTYIHSGEAEGLVQSMDRLGIQAMALIAFDSIGPDFRGGNDRVAAAMRDYPGRFLGYATVDPNEPESMRGELERCFEQLGFHAIKFHCDSHGYPADGENYRPALELANANELAVLIHGRITEEMLKCYPKARFLSAHVGGWNGRGTHYAVELAKRYSNIYLDLASSTVYNGVMEKLVAEAGADRIVHGSDAPLMDPGCQLGRVLAARISAADREKILYCNAVRLFHLGGRG